MLMFVLFSIVMVAIVGTGGYGYVMAQKKLANQDNSLAPDIKVWGLTPLSFLGAIVLAFIVFGFFDSFPYQKSISEKNKQMKSLEAKLDSLNMEYCRMKVQLDNMRTLSDNKTSRKSCASTLRQGNVTVLINRKSCPNKTCNNDSVNH